MWRTRFWYSYDSVLQSPANGNLGWCFLIFLAYLHNGWMDESLPSCQWTPGLCLNSMLRTISPKFLLDQKWLNFYLVNGRYNIANGENILQMMNVTVANPNSPNHPIRVELFQGLPRLGIVSWNRPVNQIQVNLIEL